MMTDDTILNQSGDTGDNSGGSVCADNNTTEKIVAKDPKTKMLIEFFSKKYGVRFIDHKTGREIVSE